MTGKLCPKIILEGTRLTLKTEIAFALNEHPRAVGPRRYRYHSPIISAEWCALDRDRFHLSTRVHQLQARGVDYDFRWLEERLLPLGFRLVLCTRRPETFGAARAQRLEVSGKPGQYDDLDAFVREQDLFRRLAGESLAAPGARRLRRGRAGRRRPHRRLAGADRRAVRPVT